MSTICPHCNCDMPQGCGLCRPLKRPEGQPDKVSDAALSVLRELVELKALKDALDGLEPASELGSQIYQSRMADYQRRKPLAWQRAREVLAGDTRSAGGTMTPVAWRWRRVNGGSGRHWAYGDERPAGPGIGDCEVEPLFAQSATAPITPHPGSGRLNQAFTPTLYEGHLEGAPPPYINISEAKTPYEEAIITVRSPRKTDGSQGDSAFIVMTKSDLQALFLRVARYWGWLPMTEEQWQRNYYLDNPDEAKKARERIEQLRLQRDEAQRVFEETTAAIAGLHMPP